MDFDEKHFAGKAKGANVEIGFRYEFIPITVPLCGVGLFLMQQITLI